eukprot:SM000029S10501  [mRNA]  locus=s29:504776:506165:+ [translate_table: standard]
MPRARYECDYCGKQFQDTPAARQRHLGGAAHQRARRAWFDAFKDSAELLAEELAKEPCKQYLRTGTCKFGNGCRFGHAGRPLPADAAAESEAMRVHHSHMLALAQASESPPRRPVRDDLPPSLQPPPEGGYVVPAVPLDWG